MAEEWIPIVNEDKALIDADITEKQTRNYCKKIWNKMPVNTMAKALENPVFH